MKSNHLLHLKIKMLSRMKKKVRNNQNLLRENKDLNFYYPKYRTNKINHRET